MPRHKKADPSSEYALLQSLQKELNQRSCDQYTVLIGDDAAVRKADKDHNLIVTTDTAVEEIHFSFSYMTPKEIGYRAMISNISDSAAMGAEPDSAYINLIFPKKRVSFEVLRGMYQGFAQAIKKYNFPIAGGDLSTGPSYAIAITLIGKKKRREKLLYRTGINDGDLLWVTGIPGRAAAGLAALQHWDRSTIPEHFRPFVRAHIKPSARVSEAMLLSQYDAVTAAMDLSDGLSKDCETLCRENNLGLILDHPRIPLKMKTLGENLLLDSEDWYFHGGEDYHLLFSAHKDFDPRPLLKKAGCRPRCIGRFSRTVSGIFKKDNKLLKKLTNRSWDHII